ncbi:hypothetical protein SARC_11351 [Sphaeroforma arctica JP610]|uniref:GATA-type domain-containing protein n=1 Tax=Sphaeroforma arctica JP610 TaxID=667725 RepID=A0A0L0FH88_9EUKA|nr:hypothetical protein SARC_11351 [Sphaeroforma arctica JP610]KNC76139.1 hypothetical protein SARC_11351 [Sphaeroforma arctica JP610]|eukprot:XP_014150041.1 hypothetical protein SARC_11351 [Sphaeroforma arctica JP610]
MFLESKTPSQSSYLDYLYSAEALNAPWKVPKPAAVRASPPIAPAKSTPPLTPSPPLSAKVQHKPILPNTVLQQAPRVNLLHPHPHPHPHTQLLPDQAFLNYINSVSPIFPLGNLDGDLHLYMMAVAESAATAAFALGGLSPSNDSGLARNKFTLKEVLERSAPITGKEKRICLNCWTADTPLWRRNHLQQFLCNACGLYLKSTGVNRPQKEFKKDDKSLNSVTGNAPGAAAVASPVCDNCQAMETSQWRRDKDNNMLCNACGLYYKMHQKCRPLSSARKSAAKRTRRWNPSAHVLKAMEEAVASSTAAQNSNGAIEFISSPMCTSVDTTSATAATSQGEHQFPQAQSSAQATTASGNDGNMQSDASLQHTWSQSSAMSDPLPNGFEHQQHTLYQDLAATFNSTAMPTGQTSSVHSAVSSPMSGTLDADMNDPFSNNAHLSPSLDGATSADLDGQTHGVVSSHTSTARSERAHLFDTHMDTMNSMNEHAINSMNERILQSAASSNLMDLAHHASAASVPSPFDSVNRHGQYAYAQAQVQAPSYHNQPSHSSFTHNVQAMMNGAANNSPAPMAKKYVPPTNSDDLVSLALSGACPTLPGLKAQGMYESNGTGSSTERHLDSSNYTGKSPVYKHPSASAASPYAHPNRQRYGVSSLQQAHSNISQLDTSPLDLCLFGIVPRSMPNFSLPMVQYEHQQQQRDVTQHVHEGTGEVSAQQLAETSS